MAPTQGRDDGPFNILDNTPVPMLFVDRDRRVRKANRAASEFAGRGLDILLRNPNQEVNIMVSERIDILLVEDSPADVRLMREAFKEGKLYNEVYVVGNGVEALAFLRKEGKYADSPRPDLILLDLNLPKKDGREVLAEVKADPDLKCIPVVILTTSELEQDILNSYNDHANCYINKPVGLEQFLQVVKYVEGFWLTIVKLPKKYQ